MKRYVLIAAFCACTLSAQPNPGAGFIEGHVVNALTRSPVPRAMVILTAPEIRLVADTDAEGRFQFTSLPPGTYRLSASRAGFLGRPARRPIPLRPDERVTHAEIRLPPQSVIAGHVLDEDDEPVDRASVWILKQIYRDGRKRWDRLNTASETNDLGEYRFANLKPGRYVLYAYGSRPPVDNHYGNPAKAFYVPAYYPNAPSQQQAVPLEVGVGTEVGGIDIRLFKVVRPPSVHIRGRVTGVSSDSQIVVAVNLLPADGGFLDGGVSGPARAPDYAFDLSAPSGSYTISGNVLSGGPEAYGSIGITVTADVAGIVLPMSPAPEIAGRIRVAESGVKVNLEGIRTVLSHLSNSASESFELRSDAAGRFLAKPLRPGHYALARVRSIPECCFVREIRLGGHQISVDDFEIAVSGQLEVVLSNKAGRIAGSVVDADGRPLPGLGVTLVPSDGMSWPAEQIADDTGNFQFTCLRPGKYTLLAVEEVDDDLWHDPDFHKKHEGRKTEVAVGPSETQNVQLRLIGTEEMR